MSLGRLHAGGADVGRHDDQDVFEVDDAALRVGQAAVFEHLQQQVEDVRMRLFDFVEQHDRVRTAPHGFGQLTALFVADVSRRCADQSRDRVLLHVLRHVDADHRLGVIEQILRQRTRDFGFADAGGSEEDERADRALRVLQAGARATDRARDDVDRRVLPDDALVELFGHAEQFGRLGLLETLHRDLRPRADDVGDVGLGYLDHLLGVRFLLLAPLLFEPLLLEPQFFLTVADLRGLLELLRLDDGVFLLFDLADLVVDVADRLRRQRRLQAHARGRFVDQIDGLVGQEAVADVAVAELRRGHQRFVGDDDLVMRFVAVAQTLENLDGLVDRRLADHDGLEAAFERRVLFDVLAELVERRRADALQLAARERRLDDVRCVDRAFGGAGADERVQLVDEQDDLAGGAADLVHDALHALFEFAAVLRAGDEARRGRA